MIQNPYIHCLGRAGQRLLLLSLLLWQGAVSAQGLGEPILPIPTPEFSDAERAQAILGQRLFHDTRFSRDNTTRCASCHSIELGGADGQAVSTGIGGAMGSVNSPTVINSVFNLAQFRDGRAASLEVAITTMARYQLGRTISHEEGVLIIRFLESLVGTLYLVQS